MIFHLIRGLIVSIFILVVTVVIPKTIKAHHLRKKEEFSKKYFEHEGLFRNWGGFRTWAFEQGIVPEVEYSGDFFGTVIGGKEKRFDYAGFLDLDLHIDGNKLLGWENSRFFINGIGAHGTQPSSTIGTPQTVSSVEFVDTFKIFQAWAEFE